MKLTIVGAGAIGGVTGAHLIRAGHQVTFVDLAEEHVARINADGLRIEGIRGDFTVPARAITPDELRDPLGAVVVAVKAMHTEAATRQLVPFLRPASYVVSLQNGLNEETIAIMTRVLSSGLAMSGATLGRKVRNGSQSLTGCEG